VDLSLCGMVLEKNGEVVATGAGAAALGSPVNAVAWLASRLGQLGIALEAGEVVLSGSLAAMLPAQAGDSFVCSIGGMGTVSTRFV
jgi:2-oxopent-4-enoate/cis-2-oxohex-4-enoate hydratase